MDLPKLPPPYEYRYSSLIKPLNKQDVEQLLKDGYALLRTDIIKTDLPLVPYCQVHIVKKLSE